MSGLDQIGIALEGIAHVLADNRLKVPVFQRSYAWQRSHVVELLQDVTSSMKAGSGEYFLGSVVVSTEHTGLLEVVDGQQRLATVSLIIAQIRDYFIANGEVDRAGSLESDYLLKRDLRTQEAVPRLTLNEVDHDFFAKTVLLRPGAPGRSHAATRKSHHLLADACAASKEFISALAKTSRTPIDALVDVVEYLATNAKIILVRVPDQANAFTIFETLNDRGLDLAISDLLKNYLFSRGGNRLPEIQAAWSSMLGALTAIDTDASVVDYIRHYWSSIHGATRERELYSNIRKRTTGKQSAVDLAAGLETSARFYAALLSPGHELWNEYGATTRQHVETINLLRMVQVRPLLLAILRKFSNQEAKKAIRLVVAWGVRFLVHGGLGGGVLEDNYCQRAKSIHEGVITTSKQLAVAMANVVPTDGAFETAFATATVSQAYLARYYLRVLENEENGEEDPELVPNANEEEINLEHVLPLKPEGNWPQFDDETARTFQRRLGNLVLLQHKVNSAMRSDSFAKKRPVLSASSYKLTSEVGRLSTWDKNAIAKRQAKLARLAVSAWPIK